MLPPYALLSHLLLQLHARFYAAPNFPAVTKAGDMASCASALQMWQEASGRGHSRKARLEAMIACNNVSVSLTQEANWVRVRLQLLASTASQATDSKTASDLQLAQRLCKKHQVDIPLPISAHSDLKLSLWLSEKSLKRVFFFFLHKDANSGDCCSSFCLG